MFNTNGKESVTITVRGYSMRPFLDDRRDKVILTPPRTPRIGDVVLARIADKRYALHRVIKKEGERYIMRGDGNPLYMKESFAEEDIIGMAHTFCNSNPSLIFIYNSVLLIIESTDGCHLLWPV